MAAPRRTTLHDVAQEVGVSAKTVAASLGHKHTQINTDRYTHDSKAAQQAAAEKLQARRDKKPS